MAVLAAASHPGFCGVLVSEELSEQGRERLTAFAKSTDGFALAELDFQMRGPGRFVRHATAWLTAVADGRLAAGPRDCWKKPAAKRSSWSAEDPELKHADHARLRKQMLTRYGQALDISDVG